MGGQRRHETGQLNMVEKGTLNQTMLYCGNVDCGVFISKVIAVNDTQMEMITANNRKQQ